MINLSPVLELTKTGEDIGCSVGLADDSGNNMFKWNIIFNGPEGTIYEVSLGNLKLKFLNREASLRPRCNSQKIFQTNRRL